MHAHVSADSPCCAPANATGAHKGVGLGRMFLRHLRRTRLLLHVVDGAAADPGTDYLAVREELRLYNPDYVARPHIVALNKVDLEDAGDASCGKIPGCISTCTCVGVSLEHMRYSEVKGGSAC